MKETEIAEIIAEIIEEEAEDILEALKFLKEV